MARNRIQRRFRHTWSIALRLFCSGRDGARMIRRAHGNRRRSR